MYQGVRQGMGLTPEQEALLDERIFIYRDTTRTGAEFVDAASALVDRHKPDLVWADPLLNYIGDEISEQRVISEFCCKLLNAVSLRTGVIWCLLHHTGKPSQGPEGRQPLDRQRPRLQRPWQLGPDQLGARDRRAGAPQDRPTATRRPSSSA